MCTAPYGMGMRGREILCVFNRLFALSNKTTIEYVHTSTYTHTDNFCLFHTLLIVIYQDHLYFISHWAQFESRKRIMFVNKLCFSNCGGVLCRSTNHFFSTDKLLGTLPNCFVLFLKTLLPFGDFVHSCCFHWTSFCWLLCAKILWWLSRCHNNIRNGLNHHSKCIWFARCWNFINDKHFWNSHKSIPISIKLCLNFSFETLTFVLARNFTFDLLLYAIQTLASQR